MASPKNLIPCLALLLLISFSFSESREFHVGTKRGLWEVPSSSDDFNKWAARNRFEIGDSIVLKYDGETDSVLEVQEEAYKGCNTSDPIRSYDDGNTKIDLERSGAFFFISGADGHCGKGQKLEIKVLSAEHSHGSVAHPPSPSDHHHAPAPSPHKNGGSVAKVGFIGGFAVAAGILAWV